MSIGVSDELAKNQNVAALELLVEIAHVPAGHRGRVLPGSRVE